MPTESTETEAISPLVQDAERYRFLRDNPLQLRAIDGNASFGGSVKWGAEHFDRFVDAAIEDAARSPQPSDADA